MIGGGLWACCQREYVGEGKAMGVQNAAVRVSRRARWFLMSLPILLSRSTLVLSVYELASAADSDCSRNSI